MALSSTLSVTIPPPSLSLWAALHFSPFPSSHLCSTISLYLKKVHRAIHTVFFFQVFDITVDAQKSAKKVEY